MKIVIHALDYLAIEPDWQDRALGGTETAAISMARALAKRGHDIDLYCACSAPWFSRAPEQTGTVHVYPTSDFLAAATHPIDVLVVQRDPRFFRSFPNARLKILWCHDQPNAPFTERFRECLPGIDRVFLLSQFHKAEYERVYGQSEKYYVTRNGVDLSLFEGMEKVERADNVLLCAARPERGLDVLDGIMPSIRSFHSDTKLYTFSYGDDTLRIGSDDVAVWGEGKLRRASCGKRALYYEMAHATLYIYPTPSPKLPDFREVSCIAAIEAQAAGLPIVASKMGALPETIHPDAGILVEGGPKAFAREVIALLNDPARRATMSRAGREHAKTLDWEDVAVDWEARFTEWLVVKSTPHRGDGRGQGLENPPTHSTPPVHNTAIGMFAQRGVAVPPDHTPIVFGMHVAVRAILTAIAKHGRRPAQLYTSPGAANEVRDEVAGKFLVRPVTEALDKFDEQNIGAWLDLGGDVARPFRLRRMRSKTLYPIAIVQHAISYAHFLHDWHLRLLLEDVHPCDTVICTSRAAKQAIEKQLAHVAETFNERHGTHLAYRGRLDVVPLGVDAEHFKAVDRFAARVRLGLAQDETILLWIGRISSQDKADLAPLLQIVRLLQNEKPSRKIRLVLAGTARPDEAARLNKTVTDLHLEPHLTVIQLQSDDPRRVALYSAADVFVSPVDNVQETFGLTPLEAMSCGLPVVASDWNGYRDTIVDRETGFLVPTCMSADDALAGDLSELPFGDELADHAVMAQATAINLGVLHNRLAYLIDDPELRQKMGAAGRQRALDFSWPRIIKQYEALLEELADHAVGRPSPLPGHERVHFAKFFGHYATHVVNEKPTKHEERT